MKKFKVTLSYVGSIAIDVDAENEKLAISKAEEMADNMDAKEFVEKLQPQLDYHDAEEIAEVAPTWKKPRFTAVDVLKGAYYEEEPWLKDKNDSMELDSDPVDLAYLKNTILTRSGRKITVDASVRVQGDVRVRFKGQWYRSASSMPKELIQCYHDGSDPAMIDPDYYVDNNNWFEQFVRITDEDGLVIYEDSSVIDNVNGMKEGLADSIAEILNDDEECIGALFVEGDTVRWDDPDGSLSEQMTAEELEEYRARQFMILDKRDEDCTIEDDCSEIQVPYSELRILTVD